MEKSRGRILLVDDEESNLSIMSKILQQEIYEIVCSKQAASALNLFRNSLFDLVLTDLRMPGVSGMELLRAIRKSNQNIPVILLTAYGTVGDAVEAMKLGAVDFLSKPISREDLIKSVENSIQKGRKNGLSSTKVELIGCSPPIQHVKKNIKLLAKTNAAVLIEGESGTGKEVVAQLIHSESSRMGKMVSLNCGAIPENLLESELFGYEKGAFTGANTSKQGMFELADHGTLFLDEIGEMPLQTQVKLLRALQEGVFYRLGGVAPIQVDVRIVSATNADLKRRIQMQEFREDLFYRLNVISILMPPLRDRGNDIKTLADYFLTMAKALYNRPDVVFSEESLSWMETYGWPGNVRELKNWVERTLVLSEDHMIHPSGKEILTGSETGKENAGTLPIMTFPVGTTLKEMEITAIRQALDFTMGDKVKAAELLGINPRTIYRRLEEVGNERNPQ